MNKTEKRERFRSKLMEGFDVTTQRLLAFKRYKKTPLIVSKNGKILQIYPDEFEAELKHLKRVKSYEEENSIQLVSEPSEKNQPTRPALGKKEKK